MLVADRISSIREPFGHFGSDFTPEYELRARDDIAENHSRKHGARRRGPEDRISLSPIRSSAHEQVTDRLPKREAFLPFVRRQLFQGARFAQPS